MALTASATSKVLEDIKQSLELQNPSVFKASFERANIAYEIIKTEDKMSRLINALKTSSGSSIVYCRSRKETIQITSILKTKGMHADYFHGGLSGIMKKEKLQDWQQGVIKTMVATTAFGMGIDKDNVRTVVHVSLPESLESFYQESGRAGRDGKASQSILLLHKGDAKEVKEQFLNFLPNQKTIVKCYKHLCNYFQIARGEGENATYHLDFQSFCKTYKLSFKNTMNCLESLDRKGVLMIKPASDEDRIINITAEQRAIRRYLEQVGAGSALLQYILRNFTNVFSKNIRLHLPKTAKALKTAREKVEKMFIILQENNLIEVVKTTHDLEITFVLPRDESYIKNVIAPKIVAFNKSKEEKNGCHD